MIRAIQGLALAAAVILPSQAAAQVSLSPANPSRWDVAANVGWFGAGRAQGTPQGGRDAYQAVMLDAGVGYYWTPNVKFHVDVATTGKGDAYTFDTATVPGLPYPPYRIQEHRIHETDVAAGVTYQFLENRWFHPFVGAGAIVVARTDEAEETEPFVYFRTTVDQVVLPPLPALTDTTTSVRPFTTLGFKAYVSERVFFRTDLRLTVTRERAESAAWRAGFGFDF